MMQNKSWRRFQLAPSTLLKVSLSGPVINLEVFCEIIFASKGKCGISRHLLGLKDASSNNFFFRKITKEYKERRSKLEEALFKLSGIKKQPTCIQSAHQSSRDS